MPKVLPRGSRGAVRLAFSAAKINCKRMANKRAGALIYRVTMDTNDDNKLNQDNAQGEANGMPISYSLETLPVSLETEMKRSYLDYAMSVIVGRALPDVRDGFKPVHRRVLFSMHELGNDFSHATKKCARIVGDVIGKYHPHGDQAVYQTLVRLAQDFSMRYPLVWGQGNFGSIDGDGAAAMRYTECRLARIADAMLDDLEEDTVDFVPNFDNSEKEPSVLPARLPNLLVTVRPALPWAWQPTSRRITCARRSTRADTCCTIPMRASTNSSPVCRRPTSRPAPSSTA